MPTDTRSPAQLRNMFGANLRKLSEDFKSVSSLARELGINRTQFNRYLSGESFPRPDVLARICDFFDVDARVLLEPVEEVRQGDDLLSGRVLRDFMGDAVRSVSEADFPSGFYRFSRRSFVRDGEFVCGLVEVSREDGGTFLRGFEPKTAMALQGIPPDPRAREYRGYVLKVEDGVAITVTRRGGVTASFNYLNRINSFQNNYWVGYVARTVRESPTGLRMTRLVYEYLPGGFSSALKVARTAGFVKGADLVPYHLRLLQPDDPFR